MRLQKLHSLKKSPKMNISKYSQEISIPMDRKWSLLLNGINNLTIFYVWVGRSHFCCGRVQNPVLTIKYQFLSRLDFAPIHSSIKYCQILFWCLLTYCILHNSPSYMYHYDKQIVVLRIRCVYFTRCEKLKSFLYLTS